MGSEARSVHWTWPPTPAGAKIVLGPLQPEPFQTAYRGFFESRHYPLPIGDPTAGLQNSKLARGTTQSRFDSRLELSMALDQEFRDRFDQKKVRSYNDAYDDAVAARQAVEYAEQVVEAADASRQLMARMRIP